MKAAALALDWWLLHKVEKGSRWIQTCSGWDCFLQARGCYGLAGLFQLLMIVTLAGLSGWFIIFGGSFYAAAALWYAYLATRDEDQRLQRYLGLGASNYRKLPDFAPGRLLILSLCIFNSALPLVRWQQAATVIALALAFYLKACDPLPPSKGKAREWWASLGKQPVAVQVGAH